MCAQGVRGVVRAYRKKRWADEAEKIKKLLAIKDFVCLLLLKCWSSIFCISSFLEYVKIATQSEKDSYDVTFVDRSVRFDFMTFSFRNREFEVAGLG